MTSPAYVAIFFGEKILHIEQETGSNQAIIYTNGAHNLIDGTEVLIKYVEGVSNINDNLYPITTIGPSKFSIPIVLQGTYTGGGTYAISYLANNFLTE